MSTQEAPFEIIFGDSSPAPAPPAPVEPVGRSLGSLDDVVEPTPEPVVTALPEPVAVAASSPAPGVAPIERWLKVLHFVLIAGLLVTAVSLVKVLGGSGTDPAARTPEPAPKQEPPKEVAKAPEPEKIIVPQPKPEPKPEAKPEPPKPEPEPPKPEPKVEPKPEPPKPEPEPEKPKPATTGNGDAPKVAPGPTLEDMQFASLLEEAAALAQTDPVGAIAKYARALELKPQRTDLLKNIADLHLAREEREEAARAYRAFLKYHPTRSDALNNLGVLALQAGRYDEAQRCLDAAIEVAPSANAYYNLGNLHLKRNELDRAAAAYRRTLEYDRKHDRARFNLAIALERQNRLAEAAATLTSLGPDVPEATRERVRIEAMMGGAEAKRALDGARASSDVALVLAAAAGFRKVNELEKSLALLDRAVELAPNDPTALTNRGVLRQSMGRPVDAIADYDSALKADATFADAHFNLGVLREERGELVKALEHYASAIKARPAMAPAHNNIGALYLKVNQPQKAVECFRRAATHDPEFAPARLNLGWAYLALNQKERALEELKAYVSRVPKDQVDPSVLTTIESLEKKP